MKINFTKLCHVIPLHFISVAMSFHNDSYMRRKNESSHKLTANNTLHLHTHTLSLYSPRTTRTIEFRHTTWLAVFVLRCILIWQSLDMKLTSAQIWFTQYKWEIVVAMKRLRSLLWWICGEQSTCSKVSFYLIIECCCYASHIRFFYALLTRKVICEQKKTHSQENSSVIIYFAS